MKELKWSVSRFDKGDVVWRQMARPRLPIRGMWPFGNPGPDVVRKVKKDNKLQR